MKALGVTNRLLRALVHSIDSFYTPGFSLRTRARDDIFEHFLAPFVRAQARDPTPFPWMPFFAAVLVCYADLGAFAASHAFIDFLKRKRLVSKSEHIALGALIDIGV